MSRKTCDYNKILKVLSELKQEHPKETMGKHLFAALVDYGDFWGIEDKTLLSSLQKYKDELSFNVVTDKELQKIIEEGKNLDTLFVGEEEEEDGNY